MTQQTDQDLRFASFIRRFIAYFLDNLLLMTFTFIVSVITFKRADSPFLSFDNLESLFWLVYGLHTFASLGYFTILIGGRGATLGKLLLGIRVVSVDGSQVSYFKAFVRAFGYFVSALFVYIGFLIMLIDPNRQTFHDKVAGTYVVEID